MIVLGIDPGTVKAGYGVIDARGSRIAPLAYGVIRGGQSGKAYGRRLKKIYSGFMEIIERYQPEHIILETAFSDKSIKTAIKIGEGRAMAVLAAAMDDIPLMELQPALIKKAVTGRGDATKEQVAEMVKAILGLDEVPQPNDASDALACAIAGYHRKDI